ncbi:hypothetical protein CAOG_009413 [Capsaspora owczarzaki ATCC 30864]|uniref:PH domain-containing protein n=1 Tax=Capsaspora owczarzaki (strain ATCC 30864) TaxID=595528 RepID=A0A0D2U401_CAPO3|nr:hypothetical protein CAOG_009413 [Capsaspora owczarzaki ATCC 30864]
MSESQPGRPQGGNVTRSRTLGQKLQRSSLVAAEDDLRSQFWRPHYREIADKMGELTKQGRDSLFRGAKWERRFCLLQDDNLFYFKRREDELPIGVMSIKNATIIKEHSHDHKPCISITAQESHNFESQKSFAQRTYNFLANSDDDCEQWVRALALAGQRTTGRRSQSVSGFGHSRRSNSDSSSLVANLSLNQPGREKDREAFLNGSSSSSSATTTTTTTSSSSSSSLPPSSPYKPVTTGQSSMLSPSQSTPAAAAALPPARPPKPATADSPKAANGTSGGLLISGGPPARPPKKPAAAANSVPMSDTLNLDDLLKPNMTDHAAQCSWITPAGALSSDIDTFIDEIELINTDLSKATSLPTAAQTIPDADFIVSPVTRIVQAVGQSLPKSTSCQSPSAPRHSRPPCGHSPHSCLNGCPSSSN